MNQCDGCRRGLAIRISKYGSLMHDGPDGMPVMICTAERYYEGETMTSNTVPSELHRKDTQFLKELGDLLNRYSKENGSNTPDFILAEYLRGCLRNFDITVTMRERWYGRYPKDAGASLSVPAKDQA